MEAAVTLEARLADVASPTPPGFLATVMERVSQTPQVHPISLPVPARDLLPWWVQAAAQPTTVLAFAVIALILWQGNELISVGATAVTWINMQSPIASSYLISLFNPKQSLAVWLGVFLGFAPLLAGLFFGFYRGSQVLFLALSGTPRALARN
jgi:hypothetical protein